MRQLPSFLCTHHRSRVSSTRRAHVRCKGARPSRTWKIARELRSPLGLVSPGFPREFWRERTGWREQTEPPDGFPRKNGQGRESHSPCAEEERSSSRNRMLLSDESSARMGPIEGTETSFEGMDYHVMDCARLVSGDSRTWPRKLRSHIPPRRKP